MFCSGSYIVQLSIIISNELDKTFVRIRTKTATRCDFRTDISVHGLCDRNMGL